jgi:HK97 family phage major capsid protein
LSQDEMKALSAGSDPDGGYLLPASAVGSIVKKVYETSEMRQYADVMTIGTDALEGIEDLGEAGVGYAGEKSTSGDETTPQVGKWSIQTWILDTEPKITQKLLDDANVDVEAWLAAKVGDKFGRFENSEFVVGSSKIRGITSYTTAADSGSGVTWGSFGHVATGVSGDFAASTPADILFDVMGLLKNAYLPGAVWATRRSVITRIRKFKESTTNGYIWQPGLQAGQPERLLNYPIARMEDMPALGANSLSIGFGNLKEAYQIVDRQGLRTLRDPYTAKPYVKFYTTKRTGGGAKNFEALKFVKFI